MPRLTRILSDIHFGHKASTVKRLEQLSPLTDGVDHLIFNGDSIEQKYIDSPLHESTPLPNFSNFSEFFECRVPKVTYITGNHDPQLSDIHHCFLNNGQVFVTHGDALFHNVAPWCSIMDSVNKAIDKEGRPGKHQNLTERLSLIKKISVLAHRDAIKHDPTGWGKLLVFIHQAWPPTRPFKILKAWKETPDRAVQLAKESGVPSKIIIIGHTHCPGIWQRGEYLVINTGSFFPWPKRFAIDVEGNSLKVRKILKQDGKFVPGPNVRELQLKKTEVEPLFSPQIEARGITSVKTV